jgi:PAS domain S-box-containing protein
MRKTEVDYKHFFDLSPDLLCIAGYDGFFKKINPAVSKLLGYSEEELYARPINDFVFENDKNITSGIRKNITRVNTVFHFENRYVTKSGDIVWLAWTSHPVQEDELIFAIAKDITHKKRLESERLNLLDELTKVNNQLKEFTLTASHDLRSPVTNLTMLLDLLDTSTISDKDTLQLIEFLISTGGNLSKTLNTYVDVLSENLTQHAKLQEVDLEESLNNVTRSIESLIEVSKATIDVDFSDAPVVSFNKMFMESVFLNLITNAIKYARPEVPPVISMRSGHAGKKTRIIISDNGRGFDMEAIGDKIFGLNQTFHDHEDSRGVGLYLVHRHITSLGGDISVESKVDEGARFIISFKDSIYSSGGA